MKALIIGNSSSRLPEAEFGRSLNESDLIIAADAGLCELLRRQIKPDIVVGDLDSCPENLIQTLDSSTRIERHPANKDLSDLELAFQVAEREGAKSVDVFKWSDENFDYTYSTLLGLNNSRSHIQLYGENFKAGILNRFQARLELQSNTLSRLSVGSLELPLSLKSEGLRWELDWKLISSPQMSLSNEFKGSLSLRVFQGSAFFVQNI